MFLPCYEVLGVLGKPGHGATYPGHVPENSLQPSTSMPEIAGFGRRLIALLIDWVVAMLTVAVVTSTPVYGGDAVASAWVLLAFWIEVSILDATLGFSIGKRITGICVVGPNGRPIGLRAFVRTALVCLVVPPLLQNKEGRGLQDVVAGSVITYIRPRTTSVE
ncbi:RDD family protein [Mumia zhuanghuii]|uniref:RDD family protein n=1 Tax=Mumia zhuanghuii TaxID=2585211 RepID=A0A5C4MQ11_9ACTN|nr:RDD family protein [Mumia zhuanghuii]TNC47654.1 RDD family protein [Mumia zhuanghuii]